LASTKSSYTRYYLSANGVMREASKLLTGTRTVPALAAGASYPPTPTAVTVTVPSSTTLGTYSLLACADDLKAVTEANDNNNCIASAGTVQVSLPDLMETIISISITTIKQGSSFSVTDTVKNQGAVATTKSSTTRYYLSNDTSKNTGDILLTGTRSVAVLAAGASSPATPVNVTVPSTTTLRTYHLLACADDTKVVAEADETNNCTSYGAMVQIIAR
jgi:trimeric autotransporter adhesin